MKNLISLNILPCQIRFVNWRKTLKEGNFNSHELSGKGGENLLTDAVADERTVMVEARDARVTNSTVFTAHRSLNTTRRTKSRQFKRA